MKRTIFSLMFVAIGILLIIIRLNSSYNDVLDSGNRMMDTARAPINYIIDNPLSNNVSFNPDKYQKEVFSQMGNFMFEWYSFEKDLMVGGGAIMIGLGLFFIFSPLNLRRFWEEFVEFFT